jgi:CRP-like cAMP-binding protein
MTVVTDSKFDIGAFLSSAGLGRQLVRLSAKQAFFSQGHPADSVFYLQIGRAKLTVVSESGKEATISMIAPGEFIGEESIASVPGLRLATATAVTACTALRIKRDEMIRVMHKHQGFSDLFVKFLLDRAILLLMAEFGKPGEPETLIPDITQETLAEMIGTTRSRVSYFMNKFRQHGFIEYNGRIRVHKSLLNVVLHYQSPGQNSTSAPLVETGPGKSEKALRRAAAVGVKVRHHDSLKD